MKKEKVLKFMRIKDQIIFEETGYHIFDEELFDEDFSEEDCKKFTEQDPHFIFNYYMCPWCFKFTCGTCSFGYKYGQCDEDDEPEVLYLAILGSLEEKCFIHYSGIKEAWEESRNEKS